MSTSSIDHSEKSYKQDEQATNNSAVYADGTPKSRWWHIQWTLRKKSVVFLTLACGVLIATVLCIMYFVTLPAFVRVEKSNSRLDASRLGDVISSNYYSLYQGLLTNSVWDIWDQNMGPWQNDSTLGDQFMSDTFSKDFMLRAGLDHVACYNLSGALVAAARLSIDRADWSSGAVPAVDGVLSDAAVLSMINLASDGSTVGGFYVGKLAIWFFLATHMLHSDGSGPAAGVLVYAARIVANDLKMFASLMTRCVSLYPTYPSSDAPSWLLDAKTSLPPTSVNKPTAGGRFWTREPSDVYKIVHIDGADVPLRVRGCHESSAQSVSRKDERVLSSIEFQTFDGESKVVFAIDHSRDAYDIGVQTLIILTTSISSAILLISILGLLGIDFMIVRPIRALQDEVLRIRSGEDLERPISLGRKRGCCGTRCGSRSHDEVELLGQSFNQMRRVLVVSRKQDLLLANFIPPLIARRIMKGEMFIADEYRYATILFTDIEKFTEMSSVLDPIRLVTMLNGLVSTFDTITAKYGIEKVKTIGDAYMCVSGVPEHKSPEEQVETVFIAAMEILALLRDWESFPPNWMPVGIRLRIRVGAAIGPVIAGVLGQSKKVFDVYGDTVNVASRMESHSRAGVMQMTAEMYSFLPQEIKNDSTAYRWLPPSEVQVKGKGRMSTVLVCPRYENEEAFLTRAPSQAKNMVVHRGHVDASSLV